MLRQQPLEFNDATSVENSSVEPHTMQQGEYMNRTETQENLCYVSLDDLSAEDNLVSALSSQEDAARIHNSRYVYIRDRGVKYFGQILRGPIYTPEWGAVRDGTNVYPIVSGDKVEYVPSYHGYVQIQILGEIEQIAERLILQKTFHRPHPKSKIDYVPETELLQLLKLPSTDNLIGILANYPSERPEEAVKFCLSDELIRKQLGIFGATGQGKSNTVLTLAETLINMGWCVIIFDHSGEYTECNNPSSESHLFTNFWNGLGVRPQAIDKIMRLVPVTEKNPPSGSTVFSIESKNVPFSVLKSLLRLSEAQDEHLDRIRREVSANYDGLNSLLNGVRTLLPQNNSSRDPMLRKIENLIALGAFGKDPEKYRLFDNKRQSSQQDLVSHPPVFGSNSAQQTKGEVVFLSESLLIQEGTLIVVDFGNTVKQDIINLTALDILHKLERAKASVRRANRTKVALFLEEAHTYFSADYAGNDQIARSLTNIVKRIFKIGRKFYLNPVVISQQPSDVPAAILSQCNTRIIHQLSDDEDIRKVTKGSARLYQSVIPDLRTGEALVTNSEFTTAQIIRVRPARARKIDPFLTQIDTSSEPDNTDTSDNDYIPDEE
jgi:DNA helicase HerA-like ATPase